jgi:hypothetical protein
MDIERIRPITDEAQANTGRRRREAEAAWLAGEAERQEAAIASEDGVYSSLTADLETRIQAVAHVGKRSCCALVGVLDATARPRKAWFTNTIDPSICARITELLQPYGFYFGTELREGIRELAKDLRLPYGAGGKVAMRIYDDCTKAGFRAIVSCTNQSTRETWCSVEIEW